MTASACFKCGTTLKGGDSLAGLCPACLLTTALSSSPDFDQSADVAVLSPGATLGPFQIVGVLGKGGMAAVYEAYDPRLDRAIALKVLPPEFLHDETFARRFEKEARVIARLEHPNIVPIYASGIDEGIPWMSMRLLAGGTMSGLLGNGRPPVSQAVQILRKVANALDYAHARGVVHRDVKPTNILLDSSGEVYVADFGLAQMLEGGPGLTRTGSLSGTPSYMAPEQALGNPADYRCDIYSLGIVAYETFVGTVPFKAASPVAVLLKHVNEQVPVPPDGLVPSGLMRQIQIALAKNPTDRWPSADAFVAALEAAIGHPLPGNGQSTDRPRRSRIRRTAAAGGALCAAAGLAWLAMQPSPLQAPPLRASDHTLDIALPTALGPAVQERAPASVNVTEPNRPVLPKLLVYVPQEIPVETLDTAPLSILPGIIDVPPTPMPPSATRPGASAVSSAETHEAPVPVSRPPADRITPPIRIRTVSPEYPTVARAAGLEGDVLLLASVGPDGTVKDVQVLRTVHPVLDEAARKAVLQYEYVPGRRNGIVESAVMRITVSFRLR